MDVAKVRARARVPLTEDEEPYAEALGIRLRELRESFGLSRSDLSALAVVSPTHIGILEWGCRRTRRSTLERMARYLVGEHPDPDSEDAAVAALVEELVALAGPALAGESDYADRVERRRARRQRKAGKVEDQTFSDALPMARSLAAQALAEYRTTGRWPDWLGIE